LGISRLIGTWQPSQIVIREGAPLHRMVSMRKIVRKARIPVVTIRRSLERGTFKPSCINRFERAAAIASTYGQLLARLPEKRKPWEREPYQMRLFNAVAVGLTHLGINCELRSTAPPSSANPALIR